MPNQFIADQAKELEELLTRHIAKELAVLVRELKEGVLEAIDGTPCRDVSQAVGRNAAYAAAEKFFDDILG